jgi:hypothetical protein
MPIPLLSGAVSAIAPMLARKGFDLLSTVFRGTVDKGTEQIAELVKSKTGVDITDVADGKLTDAQWQKLKEFEQLHQEEILSYLQGLDSSQLETTRIEQKDRPDAHSPQKAALDSDDKFAGRFIYGYAIVVTILTFAFIFLAAFHYPESKDAGKVIDTVLGFLLGVSLSAIIQFFFGSSQGSSNKQKQIERLTERVGLITPPDRGGQTGVKP